MCLRWLFLSSLFLVVCGYGTTYTVTNTSGSNTTPGSLGYEIGLANGASGSVVDFDPSVAGETITLTSDLTFLYQTMTIQNTHAPITLNGAGNSFVQFGTSPLTVTLGGLNYTHGSLVVADSNQVNGVLNLQEGSQLSVSDGGLVAATITATGALIQVNGAGASLTNTIDLQANALLELGTGTQATGAITVGGAPDSVATLFIGDTATVSQEPTLNPYSILALNGTSNYMHSVTVNNLCELTTLSTSQITGDIVLEPGGYFLVQEGSANINGIVTNAGELELGTQLTVSSDYSQTGELVVDINVQGQVNPGVLDADTVDINGTIDVGQGSSYLVHNPYVFLNYNSGSVNLVPAPGTAYNFVVGPYTPATSPYNFSYAITLLTNAIGTASFGGNAGSIQTYLENIIIIPGSDLNDVVNAINGADPSDQEAALAMMTPALFGAYDWQELTLQSHIAERVAVQGLCRTACDRFNGFWVEVIKDNLYQRKMQNLQGFHAPAWTILGGYTRQMVPGLSMGAFYGYSESKIHWKQEFGWGKVHQNSAGVNVNGCTPEWKWDLTLMGGWQNIHSKREIDVPSLDVRDANGHQHGYSLLGQFDLERSYYLEHNVRISPLIEGDYLFVHRSGMRESGADSLDLVVQKHRANLIQTLVGTAFAKTWELGRVQFIPEITLGWQLQALLSGSHFTAALVDEGGGFTVSTTNRILNMGVVGIDLTLMTHECVRLGASYEGEFGSGRTDQQFLGHLSWTF